MISATTLACFLQFYVYWTETPFYDEKTNKAFFIQTGDVFYSIVVLLLLKILENVAFDGGLFVLIVGSLLASYIALIYEDERFKLFLMNIKSSSDESKRISKKNYIQLIL